MAKKKSDSVLSDRRTSKVLWLDLETTGVHPDTCAIIQLAAIAEKNGEIIDTKEILMRPFIGAEVTIKALEINKRSETEIYSYPSAEDGMLDFMDFLNKHVDKYNPSDKFLLAGYNVKFDSEFLRHYFDYAESSKYFGSYFFSPLLEIMTYVALTIKNKGLRLTNYKLGTVCKAFNIKFKAHDALADIMATKELYTKLNDLLFFNENYSNEIEGETDGD